jgi:hypothetical protein
MNNVRLSVMINHRKTYDGTNFDIEYYVAGYKFEL